MHHDLKDDIMRVSAIIPTYNCARFVAEAVESALAQTRPVAEVIVVDDGSTDDTEAVLQPFVNRIRYIKKDNGGVATARNRGMEEASGDAFAFLDSDDTWHTQKLEVQAHFLNQNPDVGMVGTRTIDWPSEKFAHRIEEHPQVTRVTFDELAVKNLFTTSSVLVRRTVAEKAGIFDSELRGPEDYDFWLRCVAVANAANLEAPLTGYREVPGSLGKRAASMEAGMLRILQKLDAAGMWQGRRMLRRKAHGYTLYSCAYMYSAAGRHAAALRRLASSIARYPLPFRRGEVRMALARPKLFFLTLLRLLWIRNNRTAGAPAIAAGR